MKLGEALTRRKDLSKQIVDIRARARASMMVEFNHAGEPVKPGAEDAAELVQLHDQLQLEQRDLIVRINETNATALVGHKTVSSLIAERDYLGSQIKAYGEILAAAGPDNRYGHDYGAPSKYEIAKLKKEGIDTDALQTTINPAIPYLTIKAALDRFSKQHRQVDVLLQEANWSTELL